MDNEFIHYNSGRQVRRTENKTHFQTNNKLSNTIGNQSMYQVMQFVRWTPQEDAQLTQLVQQLGEGNWIRIATQMPGRSNRQCRERWLTT